MSKQLRLVKPSKREATRRWRQAREVVRELESSEAEAKEALGAVREALKTARANERDAGEVLSELLDGEDPRIPGVMPNEPTVPSEA